MRMRLVQHRGPANREPCQGPVGERQTDKRQAGKRQAGQSRAWRGQTPGSPRWRAVAALITAVVALAIASVLALSATVGSLAHAQTASDDAISERVRIRFLTTDDFPPFNARDEEGVLVGLNVDLARAICLELDVSCEVETAPWDELLERLDQNRTDAVIAAHRVNVQTLAKADFTDVYFRTPGRFAARRDGPAFTITPQGLDRRTIAVAKGTAHEAFLQTFFRTSRIQRYDTPEDARTALREGRAELIFDDGIGLVFWVNGSLSAGCCDLVGGAYLEPLFFGDGIAVAVKRGNRDLRVELNAAIDALRRNGRMVELVQRYFPRAVY